MCSRNLDRQGLNRDSSRMSVFAAAAPYCTRRTIPERKVTYHPPRCAFGLHCALGMLSMFHAGCHSLQCRLLLTSAMRVLPPVLAYHSTPTPPPSPRLLQCEGCPGLLPHRRAGGGQVPQERRVHPGGDRLLRVQDRAPELLAGASEHYWCVRAVGKRD